MGMTQEDYDAEVKTSAEAAAKEKLAVAAVAKKVGIELTDEDVKKQAETECTGYGYETADALLEAVGEGTYYDYILTDKVNAYLADKVNFIEAEPVSIMAEENAEAESVSENDASVSENEAEEVEEVEIEAETDAE